MLEKAAQIGERRNLATREGSVEDVTIEDVLYAALADNRGCTVKAVRAVLDAEGAIDSLEGIELVTAAEVHFGITIDDDKVTQRVCRSIPRLAALVRTKLLEA